MTEDFDRTDTPTTAGSGPARGQLATDQLGAMAAFGAYWQGMRRGGDVPRRSDIDPRGIEQLLGNAFIVERIAPGLARLRIAGSHMTDLMGMEVRGMPLSAFITPAHRDALSHHLVRLFDQPAMLHLKLTSPASPGAPEMHGAMLVLPLRSDLGDISRALGCLVTAGNIGRGPRRFDIADAHVAPLETAAVDRLTAAPAPRVIPGFAESARPLDRDRTPQKGERPYLRLVKG